MKNTRSRRPDHVGGLGGDVCEPPNRQTEASYIFIYKTYVFIYFCLCFYIPLRHPLPSCSWFSWTSPRAIAFICSSALSQLLER